MQVIFCGWRIFKERSLGFYKNKYLDRINYTMSL
jgi:hypothetical protein